LHFLSFALSKVQIYINFVSKEKKCISTNERIITVLDTLQLDTLNYEIQAMLKEAGHIPFSLRTTRGKHKKAGYIQINLLEYLNTDAFSLLACTSRRLFGITLQ